LTGEKKVSKNGLKNIFNNNKKSLPRNIAEKKYRTLSSKAKEEANDWINSAFYQETSLPKGTKLDPKNPEHSEYIEKWLKHRDRVMGWDRDWEKSSGNLDTRIFRDKIPPTKVETLKKSEGIFEQRMNGTEFKNFVHNRINEIYAYIPHTVRSLSGWKYHEKITNDIVSKLAGNDIWFNNALNSRDGRDALRTLELLIPETNENREIIGRFKSALKPYRGEVKEQFTINIAKFFELYPQLAVQIKDSLEKGGYTVERVYFKAFTEKTMEIRAITERKVTMQLDPNTYGYRSDPYVDPNRTQATETERKDINVGGFSYDSGKFLNHSFFAKHGTAETDWDTQLALGEIAVLAGAGVRAIVSGVHSVIINRKGTARKLIPKSTSSKTGDTIEDLGDTLRGARNRTNNTLQDLGDTLRMKSHSTTQTLGPFKPELINQVPKDVTQVVGDGLSIHVMSYGYHPDDLVHFVSRLQSSGVSQANIRANLEKQMQLADRLLDGFIYQPKINEYIRVSGNNNINPGIRQKILLESHDEAIIVLRAEDGHIKSAISTKRYGEKLREWHRLNDFTDGKPGAVNVPGKEVTKRIADEADKYANRLEARIMGGSSASGFIVYKNREGK
jgi:hypothetical protein